MELKSCERGELRILTISGHVGLTEVGVLVAEVEALRKPGGPGVVIDLADLDNLPTAVIGAILELIRHLEPSGRRLALAAPNTRVRVALDRLGVAPMVAITDSLDEAVELLSGASGDSPGSSSTAC